MTSTRLPYYDRISQAFHWVVAAGLLWMITTAAVRFIAKDSALYDALWPWHKPVGFLMGILILWRIVWQIINHHRRPSAINLPSQLLHLSMYLLMALIPLLALMRQHGSGREFSPFGIPLMSAKATEVEWMINLGNLLHGPLGWALTAMIALHLSAVLYHFGRGERHLIERMTRRH